MFCRNNNQVFLGVESEGIYVFNSQASFKKHIHIDHNKPAIINKNFIIFGKDNAIYSYDRKNFNQNELIKFNTDYLSYSINENLLVIFDKNLKILNKINLPY